MIHNGIIFNFFLPLILIIGLTSVYSQSQPYKFENLSIEQGLSQNTVHSILQDRKGFMWFATEDGLNRYDGYNFTIFRFNRSDSSSLSDNFIWTLFEDSDGVLWVGTNNGGLNRFNEDEENFSRYRFNSEDSNSISSNSIRTIYEDRDKKLWIGTEGGGVNMFDKNSNIFKRYMHNNHDANSLSSNNVRAIIGDNNDNIWIGTEGGGLNKFNSGTGTFIHYNKSNGLPNIFIWSLVKDSKGNIWIGTEGGGVIKYANGKFHSYTYSASNPHSLVNNNITSFLNDNDNIIWICTEGGLCRYDDARDNFIRITHDPIDPTSLSSNLLRSIYRDRTGIIWIGTVGSGLNKMIKEYKNIEYYENNPSDKYSLSHNIIRSIYQDKEGILWVGTLGGGLNMKYPESDRFKHFKNNPSLSYSISNNRVTSIYENKTGDLWIGTWSGGLNKFNRKKSSEKKFLKSGYFEHFKNQPGNKNSIVSNIVQAIYGSKNGSLWIGTENGLDYYDVNHNRFTHFSHQPGNENSLSDNRVQSSCILEDRSGNLWVGTWNGLNKGSGINAASISEKKVKFEQYHSDIKNPNSLSDDRITALYIDSDNTLWIGTHGGGLNKLEKSSDEKSEPFFSHYSEKDGLASNVIYGILDDDEGNLWISTNNGLSKFNIKNKTFRNYHEGDGLQSNQFFWGASAKGNDGEMFFGGVKGLNAFYPGELKDNQHIPPIYITGFQLFNRQVNPASVESPLTKSIMNTKFIELPYKEYVITFEFVALEYTNPEENNYAYMLEGYDKDWVISGTRRYVTYSGLGSGEYTFKVKGTNSDGIWNEKGASLKLVIYPPFWKSWWFILIVFLLAAGAAVYLITSNIKRLLAVERLRTKLAADLHDNIGSSLTEISILSEVISTTLRNENKDILKSLDMISSKSRELIDKMSDIVWLVNPKRDSLYDLILRLEDNYSEILSQTNISFKSENLRMLEKITLTMEHRQHLYLIFKEGINNAITHGRCSEILLNANVHGKILTMVLKDNGIGFEGTKINSGNGLNNMKSRAEKIGGKLEIDSLKGNGTTLRFVGNIR